MSFKVSNYFYHETGRSTSKIRSRPTVDDSGVKSFNQRLVFTQLTCCKTSLSVGDKPHNLTFQLVLQHNVARQFARFCGPFKRQAFLHDF